MTQDLNARRLGVWGVGVGAHKALTPSQIPPLLRSTVTTRGQRAPQQGPGDALAKLRTEILLEVTQGQRPRFPPFALPEAPTKPLPV